MFHKTYGLGKVKLKIKWPEKKKFSRKMLKKLISGITPSYLSVVYCIKCLD